jgi:hypothetical protein
MVGSIKGFIYLVKKENPDGVTTRCFIHRDVLVSKNLGDETKKVSYDATNVVEFFKQRTVHSRIFKNNCVKTWTNST